MMPI
jgi:hypothetical protein